MKKLGPSFHRTFALNRPGLSQLLRVVNTALVDGSHSNPVTFGDLTAGTTLGPVYITSMRRYAYGTGLLNDAESVTAFGRKAWDRDSSLNHPATIWCLHYGLSSAHGPGPHFWQRIVTESLRPGDVLCKAEIALTILHCVNTGKRDPIGAKTADAAATVFLGTYTKSDSLGPLGFLEAEDTGEYRVLTPSPPPLWVFAYALAEHWSARWGDAPGVNLASVTEEGGIASIFKMGGGLVGRYLAELQREGFADVQRRTPPFQLTRNWATSDVFLERIYD